MEKPNVKENFIKKKKTTTTTIKCSRRGTKQFCEKKKKRITFIAQSWENFRTPA
jgi:hypothetical protein